MTNQFIHTAFLICLSYVSFAQIPDRHLKDTFQVENYETRIKKTFIDGQYIPKDLQDALLELDKRMEDDARNIFKQLSEEEASTKAYFSMGRWLMVKWGMEDGSRLTHYFQQNQIGFVEDMVRILMITYHRKVNQKPLDTETLFESFRSKRLEEYKRKQQELIKKSRQLDPNGG
jgi:hypothetical protein